MQTLRPSDVLRCILLNVPKAPNLACPMQDLASDKSVSNSMLWKDTLAQRRERVTVVQWDGLHLAGLASAHMRSGNRAWEIDRLFLASDSDRSSSNLPELSPDVNTMALELIERIVQEVGAHRAERVFLRLPPKSRIFSLARRAGFFPYFEESLLECRASALPSSLQGSVETPPADWQELLPEDNYSLFQLYCAATPQPVRAAVGLTFDQWRDAQESRGRRRNWVSKSNGRVIGWLGLSRCAQITVGEVLAHPGNPEFWQAIVEWALHQEGPQWWLVPDYQDVVAELLLSRQFREVERYSAMIKTVAAPVARSGLAAVEA